MPYPRYELAVGDTDFHHFSEVSIPPLFLISIPCNCNCSTNPIRINNQLRKQVALVFHGDVQSLLIGYKRTKVKLYQKENRYVRKSWHIQGLSWSIAWKWLILPGHTTSSPLHCPVLEQTLVLLTPFNTGRSRQATVHSTPTGYVPSSKLPPEHLRSPYSGLARALQDDPVNPRSSTFISMNNKDIANFDQSLTDFDGQWVSWILTRICLFSFQTQCLYLLWHFASIYVQVRSAWHDVLDVVPTMRYPAWQISSQTVPSVWEPDLLDPMHCNSPFSVCGGGWHWTEYSLLVSCYIISLRGTRPVILLPWRLCWDSHFISWKIGHAKVHPVIFRASKLNHLLFLHHPYI